MSRYQLMKMRAKIQDGNSSHRFALCVTTDDACSLSRGFYARPNWMRSWSGQSFQFFCGVGAEFLRLIDYVTSTRREEERAFQPSILLPHPISPFPGTAKLFSVRDVCIGCCAAAAAPGVPIWSAKDDDDRRGTSGFSGARLSVCFFSFS